MEQIKLRLKGAAPLVMHANKLVDPRYVRDSGIKAITSKRQKTEADELELMRLEFIGGLYWDKGPYLPGLNFDAALGAAASPLAKGGKKLVQSGVQSEDAPLIYGGKHKSPDDLFADGGYVSFVPATIPSSKARVMRCRPIFPKWEAVVTVNYLDILSADQIVAFAERAGGYVGVGDWRPRHGRFTVEVVK